MKGNVKKNNVACVKAAKTGWAAGTSWEMASPGDNASISSSPQYVERTTLHNTTMIDR